MLTLPTPWAAREQTQHYCRIVIARWEAFTGLKAAKLPE